MYVRTSSEARTETTWMHAQGTPPQTNSEKVMLLSAEAARSLEYNVAKIHIKECDHPGREQLPQS